MRLNSLAFRLFLTAAVWTAVVLPVAGLLIYSVYREDAESSFDDRLKTLLTVIQADSIDEAENQPGHPRDVGEPLFEITHSGWYWQIAPLGSETGRRIVSPSLATERLPSPSASGAPIDERGTYWLDAIGPDGQSLRVAEVVYTLGDEPSGPRYSFTVAGPLDWLETRVAGFRMRLVVALALAGVVLLLMTWFQVRFGLLPLRRIEHGLAAVRSGDASELKGELPAEIEPLQLELNALIKSNQDIIDRARTQVGNLAHALKTPLAVIINEARDQNAAGAKIAEQAAVMRDHLNHYLDRARMAARAGTVGRITEVEPVGQALCRALERIYRDKGIRISLDVAAGARFKGERQDFEEMLGNLLDNACKWAKAEVRLIAEVSEPTSRTGSRRLRITIEDDGPGLSDHERRVLGKRGVRLDETKPGSGLGLSIVTDLVQSYQGRLELDAAAIGGLVARLDLPAA